jgi:transposase
MKAIPSTQFSQVILLLQDGYSCRQIGIKTGLGKSTVHEISKSYQIDKENHVGGCPHKLSTWDKHTIIRQITTGKLDNAVQAAKFINPTLSYPVNPQTIRNMLKNNNLWSVVKTKCPLLTQQHRISHLKFALTHRNWTIEDWKRVLWTDETKINRIGSDGKVYTWKVRGEPLSDRTTLPTVKHGGGGNIMVWGCMGWNGVGKLVEVEGKMDAQQYCDILDEGVVESFEKLEIEEEERVFQQDNDPKHTSKKAKKWFEDNNIEVLAWPAQSPDLNPIEHLWVHLKSQLNKYERSPKGVFELWERLVVEWNNIPPEVCQKLIESIPRRLEKVIRANGGHINY